MSEQVAKIEILTEIEIIIRCRCGFVHFQTAGTMYFAQSFRDYEEVTCPQCQRTYWVMVARTGQTHIAVVEKGRGSWSV